MPHFTPPVPSKHEGVLEGCRAQQSPGAHLLEEGVAFQTMTLCCF